MTALWLLSVAALSACDVPTTQVLVHLRADDDLRSSATRVHVTVVDRDGVARVDVDEELEAGGDARIATLPIVPVDEDDSRPFVVRAELFAGTVRLAGLEVTSRFRRDELTEINAFFDDACRARICAEGTTCVGGVCVGSCFDPSPLGTEPRSIPTCTWCETCAAGACAPVPDGTRCGCASGDATCGCGADRCTAGACEVENAARDLVLGDAFTCILRETAEGERAVVCTGANTCGELGMVGADSPIPMEALPSQAPDTIRGIAGGAASVDLTAGAICALLSGARHTCWGSNEFGAFGDGTTGACVTTPAVVERSELNELAGGGHFCGIDEGVLSCWGRNDRAQVGIAASFAEPSPVSIGLATSWRAVDSNGGHTCAIDAAGGLRCWGDNLSGQLGVAGVTESPEPMTPGCPDDPACTASWREVTNGVFHTCAIDDDGSLFCWGENASGQLGVGGGGATPRSVRAEWRWLTASAGFRQTCAIRDDETLWCWGSGELGELGDGAHTSSAEPVQAYTPALEFASVELGVAHGCAIAADGSLWCWGRNDRGQLGVGDSSPIGTGAPRRVCLP